VRIPLSTWVLLALWSTWLHALQGTWWRESAWAPDLGVALFVVLAGRVPRDSLLATGVALALGRIAVTVEPPAAVLAGLLALQGLLAALRSVVVIRGAAARALLAGLSAALLAEWLALVHAARASAGSSWFTPELDPPSARIALATAAAALILGPLFAWLPGMTPLVRKKPWEVAASSR
jgi:hypothetical protein